jgi:3-deoxy-D-manno-octulosonic acid (KDO) 8-phosphate synthase
VTKEQVLRRIQDNHGIDYIYEDFVLWDKAEKNAMHTCRERGAY